MTKVLLTDRAWPVVYEFVCRFAKSVEGHGVQVLFLSDKHPSSFKGNLETINIFDVPQKKTLKELQGEYTFSIHKTLITERAYYDYSSFRRSQCYSRLTESEIAEKVTPYANALDYVIREKVDLVLEWAPDVFIPSLSGQISRFYEKTFRIFIVHYWWTNGGFFLDRHDMSSSEVDSKYKYFYAHPELCDKEKLNQIFMTKKTLYAYSVEDMYTFSMRIRQALNRRKSFDPPSLRHWVIRKISHQWSRFLIKTFITRLSEPLDEDFVIYPHHVTPEASLLGTYPELADQFSLIKNISMNLPYGVKLYVKGHPSQNLGLGDDYDFYRRLMALPNVRIFASSANLFKLIDHPRCKAVTVLSGTTGFDAALRRKPVFIFGRAIFGAADCFLKPANWDDFYKQMDEIMRGKFQFNEKALYAMLNAMDASIVQADMNMLNYRTAADQALSCAEIFKSFVLSQGWKKDHNQITEEKR